MRSLTAITVLLWLWVLRAALAQDAEADAVARTEALLAEFRAAAPYRGYESQKPATGQTTGKRSRVEVGRDIMKLGRSAVPLLLKTLNDPDPQVSAVAALVLGRIGDRRAAEPLLQVLQSFLPPAKADAEKTLPAAACVCALGEFQESRAFRLILASQRLPVAHTQLIQELDGDKSYRCGICMPLICHLV